MQMKTTKRVEFVACGLMAAVLAGGVALAQDPATQPATAPGNQQAQPEEPTTQPTEAESAEESSAAPAGEQATDAAEGDMTRTETGLQYQIISPAGEPAVAREGDVLSVHYTGTLEDGTVFDTSLRPRAAGRRMLVQPFSFKLGEGAVIPGWEQGLEGMKVGEKRLLVIPPELAYGEAGAGNVIPPNATLTFEVELIGLWRPDTEGEVTGEAEAPPPSEGEQG